MSAEPRTPAPLTPTTKAGQALVTNSAPLFDKADREWFIAHIIRAEQEAADAERAGAGRLRAEAALLGDFLDRIADPDAYAVASRVVLIASGGPYRPSAPEYPMRFAALDAEPGREWHDSPLHAKYGWHADCERCRVLDAEPGQPT